MITGLVERNRTLIDLSWLQYGAWRTFLRAITPNPAISPTAYKPETWATEPVACVVEDPGGELWVFDAIVKLDHSQSQRITQHPVQTGANITDHSFALPATLTMEIGMSDVMACYIPNQWGSDVSEPTKSVMAYQTILYWKNYGAPLKISTRLHEYTDMVVQMMVAPDDIRTKHGLKCVVTFQQIFTSEVAVRKESAIQQITGNTTTAPNITPIDEVNQSAVKQLLDFLRGRTNIYGVNF